MVGAGVLTHRRTSVKAAHRPWLLVPRPVRKTPGRCAHITLLVLASEYLKVSCSQARNARPAPIYVDGASRVPSKLSRFACAAPQRGELAGQGGRTLEVCLTPASLRAAAAQQGLPKLCKRRLQKRVICGRGRCGLSELAVVHKRTLWSTKSTFPFAAVQTSFTMIS